MGRLGIARQLGSWITCIVVVGWAIASCTFPEYNFSETEAGLGVSVTCKKGDECQNASCTDRLKDGTETDVDCGGDCKPCNVGQGCGCDTGRDSAVAVGAKGRH